ncbi:unnamed protein product [Dracunculus medinensis]|uniref:Cyclin-dependent kinase 7 n=1 Tax=Dracunculus medinensis TaxID=318479 RepID=A0A0N4U6B2_DRAME|nr:unnamed protein product [Dracunculus medinensis]
MTSNREKNRYEKIKHLGEGQFANVYKAKDVETNEFVAIKKIKILSRHEAMDGMDRTAIREIKLLQELHHDNIIKIIFFKVFPAIKLIYHYYNNYNSISDSRFTILLCQYNSFIPLRDVIGHKTSIQLVFDFMETDLENIIKDNSIILMPEHIKNITLQMLLGVEYLHAHWVLHRDLKPNNLLMNSSGRIKITDFGLARFFGSPNRNYTNQVVTRWYRAPELLIAVRAYGGGIDMWSVGCIIAELLLRVPLFPGETDLHQLIKIYDILGSPTDEEWPERKELCNIDNFIEMKPCQGIPLRNVFTAASDDLIELIQYCLKYNPLHRWTATQALNSQYFRLVIY